jgi:25S rRNA (uracil2634-N3)-methyltransferase
MGKAKKTKLKDTLYYTLAKHKHDKTIENKAKKHAENQEKAKKNQINPKSKNSNNKKKKENTTVEEQGAKRTTPKHKRPEFTSSDKILLLGEGNFSFAKALSENYLEEGSEGMTATCFDSEEVLYTKYGDEAKDNLEYIRAMGATVLFDVDATHLPKDVKKAKYTKIVFNFPHAGNERQ